MAEIEKQPEGLSPIKQAYLALEAMQARLDEFEARQHEPIAIVGLGCRFPGGANNPQAFWERLAAGFDATGEIPENRKALLDIKRLPANARRGSYLDQPIDEFDPQFFGIAPREAHEMDPQQRLLLEVTWEALENAAIDTRQLGGTRGGVFIGITSSDYNHQVVRSEDTDLLDGYYASGIAHSVLSGRISYILGLHGPSITVDTACSSGLTALHLAVASLRRQECDLAIVGGVNLMLSGENHISFSRFGMLSSDGRCRAFDASADGFGRGEGCGVVALRRLSDARSHGERVQALILGTGISQDGASGGLTVPNGPAQSQAIRLALQDAGVEPGAVSYVETHGTGTPLGDPIEANALGSVFAPDRPDGQPLLLGSVKTNIGHLEAAAGLAGLIKLALALQNRTLPAHPLFAGKSPLIDWGRLKLDIATQTLAWKPVNGRWIAGISGFGFSGTNVHAVLEAAPLETPALEAAPVDRPAHVLTLSAQQDASLRDTAAPLREHIRSHPEDQLADIAYSRAAGRAHFERRIAIVASGRQEAIDGLAGYLDGEPAENVYLSPDGDFGKEGARVAFLFSGQGSQYTGMGRQLYESSPVFCAALDRCAAALDGLLDAPLTSLLFDERHAGRLHHTACTQPALFALEWALAELWRSWGVKPSAVIGHSVGEYTAACLAEVFSLEDGLRLIAARGRLFGALPAGGGMAAALAAETVVAPIVARYRDRLSIAGLNAPDNTVISGDLDAIASAVAELNAAGIETRPLNVSHAFHSPLLDPALDGLEHAAASIELRSPKLRLVSNLTGEKADPRAVTTPAYWREHARRPVRFTSGIETLRAMGINLWIEIGPGKTLAGLARRCMPAGSSRGNIFTSILQGQDEWKTMLSSLASVYVRGAAVDWEGFDRGYARRRLALPTYPFQRSRFWINPRPRKPIERSGEACDHPLLGRRFASPLAAWQFDRRLRTGELAFLDDHRVAGKTLLPGTAMIEMLLAAAAARFSTAQVTLSDVVLVSPLGLEAGEERQVQTVVDRPNERGAAHVQIFSRLANTDDWRLHAEAWSMPCMEASIEDQFVNLDSFRSMSDETISADEHYGRLAEAGLSFGPSLHGVDCVYRMADQALARVHLADSSAGENRYHLHPALFDAAIQASAWVLPQEGGVRLPFSIERVTLRRPGAPISWSRVQRQPAASGDACVNVHLLGEDGDVAAVAEKVVFRVADAPGAARQSAEQGLYQVEWVEQPGTQGITPAAQAEALKPVFDGLVQREGLDEYQQEMVRLEQLSVAYICSALHRLGWRPAAGNPVTVDLMMAGLKILPRYRQLTGRFLEILAEEGYLAAMDRGQWQVVEPPALEAGWMAAEAQQLCAPASHVRLEAKIVARCGAALADALCGQADPLALLFPGGDLSDAQAMYQKSPPARVFNLALSHAAERIFAEAFAEKPGRVLEVGAGTGGTTAALLPALQGKCSDYMFTDLSPLFLARAQETFGAYPFFKTAIFDLDQDPFAQGFKPASYDLIVAANVVHATMDLRQSLQRLHSLLAPGGRLLLLEVTAPQRWIDITFGLTDGWWRFADRDLRPTYPLLTAAGWEELLRGSGFDAAAFPAAEQAFIPNALMLARKIQPSVITPGTWLILADDLQGVGGHLAERVAASGGKAVRVRAGQRFERCGVDDYILRPDQRDDFDLLLQAIHASSELPLSGAVFLWGLDAGLDLQKPATHLEALEARLLGGLLHLAQALIAADARPPLRLLVGTPQVQRILGEAGPFAPAAASLWGFVLTLAREHPELSACVCDLALADAPVMAQQLFDAMAAPSGEVLQAERAGKHYAARLRETALAQVDGREEYRRLEVSEKGLLDNLRLAAFAPTAPGPKEVSIRVKAAGLNFKDVLKVLGMVEDAPVNLGSECAGVVTAVGAAVAGLQVGDAVVAVAPGAFASVVNAREELTVRKPDALGWEAAATFPVAFITAAYALHRIAKLARGERVLIHAAAGGVGLAAVQIAQQAGAQVFATAGSEEKRRYLRSLGVAHVYSSRSVDFAGQVMAATNGQGVDVVLNSLAGEMVPASLSVLAQGGRFIELGKTSLLHSGEAEKLGGGRQYIPVDWTEAANNQPGVIREMLLEILADLAAGRLWPLPVRSFDFEHSVEAFRFMAAARHTGKIVLKFPPAHGEALILKDGAYLITGGLGGLGLRLAGWLAEAGADCIVLVSRSSPGLDELRQAQAWRERGTVVCLETCDVADETRLAQVFARFGRDLPALRGIFHLAGVLDKAPVLNLTGEKLAAVVKPKVSGAWNLHRLSSGQPLDYFVLFSSVASVFGAPGQANHAAANAFMDALAHLRRSQGLPGLSINWGAWAQVGAAAAVSSEVDAQGMRWIEPERGLQWLAAMLSAAPAQYVACRFDWARFIERYPNRQAPAFFRDVANRQMAAEVQAQPGVPIKAVVKTARPGRAPETLAALAELPAARQRKALAEMTAAKVRDVLGLEPNRPVSERRPLSEMGLDSLMAVELRNRLGQDLKLGQPLPATLVFDYPTIEAITTYLLDLLPGRAPAASAAPAEAGRVQVVSEQAAQPAPGGGDDLAALFDALEDLSDDDVDRLLGSPGAGGLS